MKILKLHIEKLRGIVNLELNLDGKNAVVVGPNGVGKSAVVDAIDFLLKGDITRLTGEGTGEVSVLRHGPHIGYNPSEAKVTAEIQSVNGKIFTVVRNVANKDTIQIDPAYTSEFEAMVGYAQSGAHFLSRRELLRYILTKPTTRSEQIQSLLEIKDLKETRDAFNKLKKNANTILKDVQLSYKSHVASFLGILGAANESQVLDKINSLRIVLGGAALDNIGEGDFTAGLLFSDSKEDGEIVSTIHNLEALISYLPTFIPQLLSNQKQLQIVLGQIEKENDSIANANLVALIRSGIQMMDGTGRCPLCLHHWATEDELREILEDRQQKSEALSKLLDELKVAMDSVSATITTYKMKIGQLLSLLQKRDANCASILTTELQSLDTLLNVSRSSINDYVKMNKLIMTYVEQKNVQMLNTSLTSQMATLRPLVDEQSRVKSDAWQKLNTSKETFVKICDCKKQLPKLKRVADKATYLLETFDAVQTQALNELFASISDRFAELYKVMHQGDEEAFTATLENAGVGVTMSVDFYGKGQFPPMAFHSEGHQDSMGIALFFALMEKITTSEFGLVVLDDIVMSVDIEHRKNFCKVLKDFFPDRQFIITTHDAVWARNLINENVVEKQDHIAFSYWSVEEGPVIITGHNIWQISRDKAEKDLNGASAFFRREMECYFENICDKLSARLQYNSTHKWDYGQYMNASHKALKDLLKFAKTNAKSFKKQDVEDKLLQLETDMSIRLNAVNAENWVTNVLIHYNPQYEISKAEFLAAVNAMQRFCQCFECSDCNTILTVAYDGFNPSVLKCKCGTYSYLLKI